MLRAPRWSQCRKGQSTVQHPSNANTVPQIWRWELQAATETHRLSRSKPSSLSLPQLCQENLQEGQVRGDDLWRCQVQRFWLLSWRTNELLSLERAFDWDRALNPNSMTQTGTRCFEILEGLSEVFSQLYCRYTIWMLMSSNSQSLPFDLLNAMNNVQCNQSLI